MADKMLIDATHPEETRVVVLRGNRVEEFDFESANRKQLRGNIYLAKVTRVEPSLQAAFIEYGGNRHGFLAFSEIHPDYYQIPVADRQALLAQEEHDQRAAEHEDEQRRGRRGGRHRRRGADRHRRNRDAVSEAAPAEELARASQAVESPSDEAPSDASQAAGVEHTATEAAGVEPAAEGLAPDFAAHDQTREAADSAAPVDTQAEALQAEHVSASAEAGNGDEAAAPVAEAAGERAPAEDEHHGEDNGNGGNGNGADVDVEDGNGHDDDHDNDEEEPVESVGGADALEEVQERLPRFRRQYKIQEVIKRRQVMLVQVVKEERGSKGAALTTYLSLAGRYSVLMPNTPRGGGISRKITSAEDRGRLKEIAQELEVPEGMGVILRTAGASRTKTEVKRDFEYLLRLWETVRDLTLKSVAPKLVYEEGSLIKRSIRDLYAKEIEEIIVAGEEGFKEARDFMRMLMPSHARNVKLYKDAQPLFTRYGIESQLDAMFSPVVQLKSGGYIVINQAEALVAIDVNSGRATREHHIEDTALKTNIEAAEEVARQLRLRDLAGLIVIDFIDMDETRNNRTVERRLKEALKHDRARIQVGRISHFGLLEMSRQRIRSSVLESSTEKCTLCGGTGHVRSVSSVALQLVRAIEEMLIKGATHNLIVRTRAEVALYVLNHKRGHLRGLEERFRVSLVINADASVIGQQSYLIDRGEQVHTLEAARSLAASQPELISPVEDEEPEVFEEEADVQSESVGAAETSETNAGAESEDEGGDHRRRRRRRGRGRGRGGEPREDRNGGQPQFTHETVAEHAIAHEDHDAGSPEENGVGAPMDETHARENGEDREGGRRRRRRGRRGGRRNRQRNGEGAHHEHHNGGEDHEPQYAEAQTAHPIVSEEDATAVAPPFPESPEPAYSPAPEPAPVAKAPEIPAPAPAPVAAEAPAQEPPRRRSTIREPAPVSSGESAPASTPAAAATPAPEPVISSTTPEESGTPKRGWWGRRLLGDKT